MYLPNVTDGGVRANVPLPEDFVEWFKYQHWLLRNDPSRMKSYERYHKSVAELRSLTIRLMKQHFYLGKARNKVNDQLQRYAHFDYCDYLYYLDKNCKLCGFVIYPMKQVTCDHIVPTALGGPNTMKNKQIAHGHCNVMKAAKNIKTFSVYKSYH